VCVCVCVCKNICIRVRVDVDVDVDVDVGGEVYVCLVCVIQSVGVLADIGCVFAYVSSAFFCCSYVHSCVMKPFCVLHTHLSPVHHTPRTH
jgi:hypothetical protein